MRLVIAVPRTIVTLAVGAIVTIVLALAAIVVSRVSPGSPVIERIIGLWARTWLLLSGTRVEVTGKENLEPGRSYVIVANHLSNLDIMVCFTAIPVPIRYLAKTELFRIPILAQAMRAVGIVEVDREVRALALDRINRQAQEVVERGHSLIIYPEGTRSRSGDLKAFKKGAFTMAVSARLPVVPVTIQGTWEAWRPLRPLIFGGPVRVVIDEPIPTEGLDRQDADRLRDQARAVIEKRLIELRSAAAQS